MAAIPHFNIFALFTGRRASGKSKVAHEVALRAYQKTNGPTDNLRRVVDAYKANKAKSRKRNEHAQLGHR